MNDRAGDYPTMHKNRNTYIIYKISMKNSVIFSLCGTYWTPLSYRLVNKSICTEIPLNPSITIHRYRIR